MDRERADPTESGGPHSRSTFCDMAAGGSSRGRWSYTYTRPEDSLLTSKRSFFSSTAVAFFR